MRAWGRGLAVLAAAAGVGWAGAEGAGKGPTTREVMRRAHAGPSSLLTAIGKGLKADQPDWPAIQARARELADLGEALGKNEPPVGDRESWDRLARAYREQARALDEAARSEDRRATLTAKARIDASCRACHTAHRPPDP